MESPICSSDHHNMPGWTVLRAKRLGVVRARNKICILLDFDHSSPTSADRNHCVSKTKVVLPSKPRDSAKILLNRPYSAVHARRECIWSCSESWSFVRETKIFKEELPKLYHLKYFNLHWKYYANNDFNILIPTTDVSLTTPFSITQSYIKGLQW